MCGRVQDMPDQSGKVCIVTGGASGMGWYCAKVSEHPYYSMSCYLLIQTAALSWISHKKEVKLTACIDVKGECCAFSCNLYE